MPDCHIDTDNIFSLLVQNGVQGNRCLSSLPVADDQFSLASSYWKHGINRQQAGFHRGIHRLAVDNAGGRFFDRAIAAAAALIGAVANTFRLELVDIAAVPPTVAAFLGSMVAGIMASLLKNRLGYPRISITVPSIVIMVPGLYLYRAVYNLGTMSLSVYASWFASAMLIIVALPLGLIFARILTDRSFRYCT